MANKQKTQEEVRQEEVVNQVSKVEQFYNNYKKTLWGVLIAVLVVWLGFLGYQKLIYQPKCEEAQEQAAIADKTLEQASAGVMGQPVDSLVAATSYSTALRGDEDGNVMGYAKIIDKYGNKAGKDVFVKAGTCAYNLGEYEEAISYLKKYSGKEPIIAVKAQNMIGDCYVNLGKYDEAVSTFKKAAGLADNVFAAESLIKEGLALEALGKKAEALKCYQDVKYRYPDSMYAVDIDNYISAVEE